MPRNSDNTRPSRVARWKSCRRWFVLCFYDFLYVTADNFAELADVILRELYARGFSSSDYKLINENYVHLDYSFLSDDIPWVAWRNVDVIVKGDITDEKDYRRDKSKRGRWMSYAELVQVIGKNQAHKIFEQL